ncbi:MAG: NTP transferase domain-containing protein [Gemmatimonadetes bacterium]|nr:NTP transferase domain-containing protein [Gemmatimonadota bacterium]
MDHHPRRAAPALIIAGGAGVRLQPVTGPVPKPLLKLCGVPLIKRIILTAARAGVSRFVIVTGYEADRFHEVLSNDPGLDALEIEWVHNERWHLPNGVSALAARTRMTEPFVLLMADHLFEQQTLERLLEEPVADGECLLAVDRKIDRVYDVDDATKVEVRGDKVVRIDKELKAFNAVDTGMFLCTPALFNALDTVNGPEGCALSDGVRSLAAEGRMRAFDVGDGYWQDVDTPEMLAYGERTLVGRLVKPTDGWVSRHINRPISTRLSRWLVRTPVTPNMVTLITFLTGLAGAWFVLDSTYWSVLLGALLFQASSILDGCDGEVAVLTFRESKYGSWLDTITDNLTYLAFFAAVVWAYAGGSGDSVVRSLGLGSVVVVAASILVMYYYLLQTGGSGSLVRFNRAFEEHAVGRRRHLAARLLNLFRMMAKRDFFTMLLLGFAALDLLNWMFWTVTAGGLAMGLAIFISTGRLLSRDRAVAGEMRS